MPEALAIVSAAFAAFTAAGAILAFRVFVQLAQRGPAAAEEAFEKGDSVSNWWNAAQTPTTLDGPRDFERLAFASRKDSEFGEVLVEERASIPSFAG